MAIMTFAFCTLPTKEREFPHGTSHPWAATTTSYEARGQHLKETKICGSGCSADLMSGTLPNLISHLIKGMNVQKALSLIGPYQSGPIATEISQEQERPREIDRLVGSSVILPPERL